MSPFQLMQGMKNPKEFVMNMMGQNSNPMIGQLMQMAKNGDSQQIENFARNLCKERGIDFDSEFLNL